MTPIDLRDYSEHQCKISIDKLRPAEAMPAIALWKNLSGFLIDSSLCFLATLIGYSFFSESLGVFVINEKLGSLLDHSYFIPLKVYPFSLTSYFFFSYFLNQGQSFGQFLFKHRLPISEKNFSSSFRASLLSTAICLTGGLLFFWHRSKFIAVTHDYLYRDLFTYKEMKGIDLIEQLKLSDKSDESQKNVTQERMAA
jgi:hypothetical protein